MKTIIISFIIFVSASLNIYAQKQIDSANLKTDSLQLIQQLILNQQEDRKFDSLIRVQLQTDLANATLNANQKLELELKLKKLTTQDSIKKANQLAKIETLKKTSVGYPVVLYADTLFNIYIKIGSFNPELRAQAISERIKKLYDDDFFIADSLKISENENSIDIIYNKELILITITELDALWLNKTIKSLAVNNLTVIKTAILKYKSQNSVKNKLIRFAEILLIILCLWLTIFFINKLFKRSKLFLEKNKEKYFNGLSIKSFKAFTPEKHQEFAYKINNILRIVVIISFIYLSLPLMFSVFPATKSFTDTLIGWILSPAKKVLFGILNFLPNLFTIAVIFYVTRWTIKGIHYFFNEVKKGTIVFVGFHKDWAMPTFNILKFILYAFMIVVIFPYLPGSDSAAFQGVSVMLGILFSLGSSSAITNMIAGLVITYMRPFKIGDRVKIGEVVGDVLEKTMLVTRIRTVKNEDITVPNSTVLSSSTINYSSNAADKGLIMHSTVTIGYDVPWKKIHQALLDAADRTSLILKDPVPFVLQTSLEDFYVAYQINMYTREPNKQAIIYSELHQHIQDCCNEAGIEILSPHYRAERDGNMTSIPENYLAKDYKAPSFNVNIKKD